MGRHDLLQPSSDQYFGQEAIWNEITRERLASNTKRAIHVVILDSAGNQVNPGGSSTGAVSGRKTVSSAGTAERLVASTTDCKYIIVNAGLGNTNPVVVGGSGVVALEGSQEGIILIPGNNPVRIDIDDVTEVWVDSQTSGDAVAFTYFT